MSKLKNKYLLAPGNSIKDTYVVECFIGAGAFAEVYRVKHKFLGLQAIKDNGGIAIVQTPISAENRILPDSAIAIAKVKMILTLEEIANFLRTKEFIT